MLSPRRVLFLVLLVALALPAFAQAAVQPSYDLSTPDGGPFPSDRWTAVDWSQPTGLRVDLPKPDCAARPSDCQDIDVLNTLDGFNVQPRISIPFTGAIDPSSVSSSSVFLIRIPDRAITGINQIAWEPAADTLHVESDQLLRQHTSYILVVTKAIRDASGAPIESAPFRRDLHDNMSAPRPRPAGRPASRRRRAGDRVHDPEHHRAARADPGADQDVDSGDRGLPARSRRRPNGVPALEHQLDPLLAADQHRAGVPGLADGNAVPRRSIPAASGRSRSAPSTRPTTRTRRG